MALMEGALAQRRGTPGPNRRWARRGQEITKRRRGGSSKLILMACILMNIETRVLLLRDRGVLGCVAIAFLVGRPVKTAALCDRAPKAGLPEAHGRVAPLERAY